MRFIIGVSARDPAEIYYYYDSAVFVAAQAFVEDPLVLPFVGDPDEQPDDFAAFEDKNDVMISLAFSTMCIQNANGDLYCSRHAVVKHRDGRTVGVGTSAVTIPVAMYPGDFYKNVSGGKVSAQDMLIPAIRLGFAQLFHLPSKFN